MLQRHEPEAEQPVRAPRRARRWRGSPRAQPTASSPAQGSAVRRRRHGARRPLPVHLGEGASSDGEQPIRSPIIRPDAARLSGPLRRASSACAAANPSGSRAPTACCSAGSSRCACTSTTGSVVVGRRSCRLAHEHRDAAHQARHVGILHVVDLPLAELHGCLDDLGRARQAARGTRPRATGRPRRVRAAARRARARPRRPARRPARSWAGSCARPRR